MKGFITLAVGDTYLQRAAAFALSARRFGYPTILLHENVDPDRFPGLFAKSVCLETVESVNPSGSARVWELKEQCYRHSQEFDTCAFVDADSLVIRDPSEMFRLAMDHPIHTPGARTLEDHERWATAPGFTVREIAVQVGIPPDAPLHTLNGGFLLWNRGGPAEKWFADFSRMFGAVHDVYCSTSSRSLQVREELCMSLAFAAEGISLPRSDSSIGVWDANNLVLDIRQQRFECTKGYYWQGHKFHPYIAHFGGGAVSPQYRECVEYLREAVAPIDLPLFTEAHQSSPDPVSMRDRAAFNGFSISRDEYDALVEFARKHRIRRVLEFGPGASTWALLEAGCHVVSLEYQHRWFEHFRQVFSQHPEVRVIQYDNLPEICVPELNGQRFDFGLVDSPEGQLGRHYRRFARLNACEFVAARTDQWMLHDAQRPGERETLTVFEEKGWKIRSLEETPKLAIVTREAKHLAVPVAVPSIEHATEPDVVPSTGRDYDFSHWSTLPKVSCQCITYGRPHLLNEAVESFLRQDYAGEKELIVLNDHPKIIIEEFDRPDVKVFNVARRFRSIGEKRNACCALCTGQVIFTWDDDDISLPWRISFSLEQMKNGHYFKPDRLWYCNDGRMSIRKAVAHAMAAWSRELFDEVGGYPHMQSGQDQAIEDLFDKTRKRNISCVPPADLFYIYRFLGTESYHLSAFGYGKGLDETERYVHRHVAPGQYPITPCWKEDYLSLVQAAAAA